MRTLILPLLWTFSMSLMLIACDDEGSDLSEIAIKHNTICETKMNPTSCPDNVDLSGLVVFCKMVSKSILDTEDCNRKMDVYTACNAERSWACLEGGDLPMPVSPDPCTDEMTAPFSLPSGACIDQSKVSSY